MTHATLATILRDEGPLRFVLRRQFLVTQSDKQPFPGWDTISGRRVFVHHHPDLSVTQGRAGNALVSLIGYAIDPNEPPATDQKIVMRLAAEAVEPQAILDAAAQLGGRWALLVESDDFDILLHDACGLRQVFYSDHTHSTAFCASQASTAAKVYRLEQDPAAAKGFLETRFAKTDPEYWWPNDSTQFRGVRCLLPNHYLDLRTREVHRYGLSKKLRRQSLNRAAKHGGQLLAKLMRGVAQRHELALPLTAGWDSRALLAACVYTGTDPYCYTLRMGKLSDAHQDLAVPKRLLGSMQRQHHVIDCPPAAPADFATLYRSSVDPAHESAASAAYGLAHGYPQGFVSLSGHCSEVARCGYHDQPHVGAITAEALALQPCVGTAMDPTPFVLAQFQRWLDGARPAADQSGISLLDLFYWEQRVGRWAANGQAQWDLVHERFTAFNCRPLLLTLLSTEERHRRHPYGLYRRMIKHLAPEVLRAPINPDTAPSGWRRRVIRAIKRRVKAVVTGW